MLPGLWLLLTIPLVATAQQASQPPAAPTFTLPPVIVTAQKEPADAERLPVSVTAVSSEASAGAGFGSVSDAVVFSPNSRVVELSARKISNLFVRGIGSSPSNPGITTYIDGVPQLNSNSSNIELLDVAQIEFVRGPQSALFGRNTLGGLANLTSVRPSLTGWTGQMAAPFGSAGARDVRASVSGPSPGPWPWGCRTDIASATASRSTTSPVTRSTPGPRTSARPRCCGCRPRRGRPGSSSTANAPVTATTR